MKMNEKKRQELRKKLSDVPNPPVPNRARTHMSVANQNSENKNNQEQSKQNNQTQNKQSNQSQNKK